MLKEKWVVGLFLTLLFLGISTEVGAQAKVVKTLASIPGYRLLGYEGEVVNVTTKANIAYGSQDRFVIIYGIMGTVPITNAFFGDPAPNSPKAAYYKLVDENSMKDPMQGPDGYWLLGNEQDKVNLSEKVDLALGIGNKLRFLQGVVGPLTLNNATFGGDPAPNVVKYVWIRFPRIQGILAQRDPQSRDMVILPSYEPGRVVQNTNRALPPSYRYLEYAFPETNGVGKAHGRVNDSAKIQDVFLAQTHVMRPSHPFFFLIADRPALLEVLVTGKGPAPDVKVVANKGQKSLGVLYLQGPSTLLPRVDAYTHNFDDRFTVTLPSHWLQPGISLFIQAGSSTWELPQEKLKVQFSPELNLFMVNMDILDFNQGKKDVPIPENFLAEFAAAIPAAVTRLGIFPARLPLPKLIVNKDGQDAPVLLTTSQDKKGVADGNINAAALRFIHALKMATGDYSYSFIYGNTQNFFPGGWGGGKAFVGADYRGVFLHEMGHALSLPHWGNAYGKSNVAKDAYNYPYGGITGGGGGRGESWNFYQSTHEFVSPQIQVPGHAQFGTERSDAMQRSNHADEVRSFGPGLWDGFGDFSSLAMFRYMTGATDAYSGQVPYRRGQADFQLNPQPGFPDLKLNNKGQRVLVRDNQETKPQNTELYDFFVPQKWDAPVYTVYGSYHPTFDFANILYEPITYRGNLPALLDPTDPSTFEKLKQENGPYEGYFWGERDLTLRFTYADGTIRHALYAFDGVRRDWKIDNHPWRWDLLYFAINVPADKPLVKVELFHRPFCVRGVRDKAEGNIRNPELGITAGNFMSRAKLIRSLNVTTKPSR